MGGRLIHTTSYFDRQISKSPGLRLVAFLYRCKAGFSLSIMLLLFIGCSLLEDEEEMTIFSKLFGGAENDAGFSVKQTEDGGYIVCGNTASFGQGMDDVFLVKTDVLGNEIWSRTYGKANNEGARSIIRTKDGGYMLCGYVEKYGYDDEYDIWVMKTDDRGNNIWSGSFDSGMREYGKSVIECEDGGFAICCDSRSVTEYFTNALILRLDQRGNEIWLKSFGEGKASSNDIKQTTNGGFVITGSNNGWVYVLKIDSEGNIEWSGDYKDREVLHTGQAIKVTSTGGYVICGNSYSYGMDVNDDVYLLKLDEQGNKLWSYYYDTGQDDRVYSMDVLIDGGYIMAGSSLFRTDKEGHLRWKRTPDYCGMSIQQTNDCGFIITGFTRFYPYSDFDLFLVKTTQTGESEPLLPISTPTPSPTPAYDPRPTPTPTPSLAVHSDVMILKADQQGQVKWSKSYGGPGFEIGNDIIHLSAGGYLILATKDLYEENVNEKIWLVKIDSRGNIIWEKTLVELDGAIGIDIKETSSGNFILLGHTFSNQFGGDILVCLFDENGTILWKTIFDKSSYDSPVEIVVTKSGYCILASTEVNYSDVFWLIALDHQGKLLWEQIYDFDRDYDKGRGIVQCDNGDFVLYGNTFHWVNQDDIDNDLLLIKTDASGGLLWQKILNKQEHDSCSKAIRSSDGGIIISAVTNTQLWLLKLDNRGNVEWNIIDDAPYTDIIETPEGHYITAGNNYDHHTGEVDIWLSRYDEIGTPEGQTIIQGSGDEKPVRIVITEDNHFIIFGSVSP